MQIINDQPSFICLINDNYFVVNYSIHVVLLGGNYFS